MDLEKLKKMQQSVRIGESILFYSFQALQELHDQG